MPKNEDGEFELILGNRQLLSVFFVVVVLLGLFFVMGYIVGQRPASSSIETASSRKPDTKPTVVESPAAKPAEPEISSPPAPEVEKPVEKPLPVETAPVAPAKVEASKPKPEPAKTEPVKAAPKAEPKAEPKPVEKAKAAPPPTPSNNQVVHGATYLQLSATNKHDADAMVEVLRKNSFPAIDVEIPEKPGLYRVLVGPVPAGEYNKMKADLQAKSFEGNRAFKQVF